MFREERDHTKFEWSDLGDIDAGRPNIGGLVPVVAYRLMQYTMRDVIISRMDVETADRIFFEAGKLAGEQLCKNMLNTDLPLEEFVGHLQTKLEELKVGIVRIEKADLDKLNLTLTVAEDLDCSGLPVTDETICVYDEGFIAGLLKGYSGNEFDVKEVDCWASGDRVCRFEIKPK